MSIASSKPRQAGHALSSQAGLLLRRHHSEKVWLGLNFYGRSFVRKSGKVSDLLGHQYERVLRDRSANVQWHEQYREHVTSFVDGDGEHEAWYPSTRSGQVTTVPTVTSELL